MKITNHNNGTQDNRAQNLKSIRDTERAEKLKAKQMAARTLEPVESRARRNAKDSVFVDLFAKPEYLLQLYRALHPEDTETEADDLTIVTLEQLLLAGRYNDLGFLAGNRLMILVEAQSSWSENISIRFLLYIADTYNRYIRNNGINLYGKTKAVIPVPELYVIYTGDKENCPAEISLCRDIFGTEQGSVEIRARVIRDSRQGDILQQYIAFTRIFDGQVREHGRTRRAVEETIRICREQDVLSDYLKDEEVAEIMFTHVDMEKQIQWMKEEERTAELSEKST